MRYFAQGGGEVKPCGTDLWVFVDNPPHPFSIGDIVPDDWGVQVVYSEKEKEIFRFFDLESDDDL